MDEKIYKDVKQELEYWVFWKGKKNEEFEYCVSGLGKEKAEKNKLESNNTGLCGVVIE